MKLLIKRDSANPADVAGNDNKQIGSHGGLQNVLKEGNLKEKGIDR
jgi:hypothetical protein